MNVPAQLVQKEPITDLTLLANGSYVFLVTETSSGFQQQNAERGDHQDGHAVDHVDCTEHGNEHEPEPKEHVDFLVDDVQRQYAQAVEVLYRTGRTVVVERTLGDFGEHASQGVRAMFRIHIGEFENVDTVLPEIAVQEVVHEIQLSNNVGEIEQFANEEPYGVQVLRVQVRDEIAHQQLPVVGQAFVVDDQTVEVEHQHPDTSALPSLPDVSGNVEEHRLEEQDKAHPLVVLVMLDVVLAFHIGRHAGLSHVLADTTVRVIGNSERRVNPAVRIHDVGRDAADVTVDGIAEVLSGRDHYRERYQDDHGDLVMHAKHVIVNANVLEFQQPLYGSEHVEHVAAADMAYLKRERITARKKRAKKTRWMRKK